MRPKRLEAARGATETLEERQDLAASVLVTEAGCALAEEGERAAPVMPDHSR